MSTRIACVIICTVTMGSLTHAEEPVCFPDPALKAAVENELWMSDPTPTDMLGITYLYAANLGITDITGLEYATNLQELYLRWNRIRDISALAKLTNLEHLDAHGNQNICDISALSGLVNLQTLVLRLNRISDISALAQLTNLEKLDLQWNHIGDITPLSGLTNLRYVQLQFNDIHDISALSALTNLEDVDLCGNALNLEACDTYIPQILSNNPGMDLSYDPCVQYHRVLILPAPGGSVIRPGEGEFFYDNGETVRLEAKADPGWVFVGWSGSLSDSANPTSLTVRQEHCILAGFACEGSCPQEPVAFADGALEAAVEETLDVLDPTPDGMRALTELNCASKGISSLTGLEYASNLRRLDVSDNAISDISPLSALTSLESLDLRSNPLSPQTYEIYLPLILTMNASIELDHDYLVSYSVVIHSTSGGSVAEPGEGTLTYNEGETILLQAVAEPGFVFVGFSGSYQNAANPSYLTVCGNHDIEAVFAPSLGALYVDANTADAARANGTVERPFATIQEAINIAVDGDAIIVRPGLYREKINLLGRSLYLTGLDPNGAALPVIDAGADGPAVSFVNGEDPNCTLSGFVISGAKGEQAAALVCVGSSPTLRHCVIVGNCATTSNGAALRFRNSNAVLAHCTIADNVGGALGGAIRMSNSDVTMTHSIVWDNVPNPIALGGDSSPSILYSDLEGGWPDVGNLDVCPLFVRAGYWADPDSPELEVEPSRSDAVWVPGDYHLKSEAGRWNPQSQAWRQDDVTSPCIDAGNPTDPVGPEPAPNGGVVNLGAYGGTVQAGRSPW